MMCDKPFGCGINRLFRLLVFEAALQGYQQSISNEDDADLVVRGLYVIQIKHSLIYCYINYYCYILFLEMNYIYASYSPGPCTLHAGDYSSHKRFEYCRSPGLFADITLS